MNFEAGLDGEDLPQDPGLAQRMLFLAPGLVHGLSNALFAMQGHAQLIGSRGPDLNQDREAILKANEQAQGSVWFLRILLRDPGAHPVAQAGVVLRRLGDVLRVPCRHRGLSIDVQHSAEGIPAMVEGAPFVEALTAAVAGLLEEVPAGFEGAVALDLAHQDGDGVEVRVTLSPRSAILPFPVAAEDLCDTIRREIANSALAVSARADGVSLRFPRVETVG